MLRGNNYTTLLLTIIIVLLIMGLAIALYYVLELDWFDKKININNIEQVTPYKEQVEIETKYKSEIKYDITKRKYNIILNTEEFTLIVYNDGTIGVKMIENEKFKGLSNYSELLNTEVKPSLKNIIRAYEIKASNDSNLNEYIVVLDSEGNLYKLVEDELIKNSRYAFVKIEGIAKIIDVRPITNDGLIDNETGVNAIAIDEQSNELLLTEYLVKNK